MRGGKDDRKQACQRSCQKKPAGETRVPRPLLGPACLRFRVVRKIFLSQGDEPRCKTRLNSRNAPDNGTGFAMFQSHQPGTFGGSACFTASPTHYYPRTVLFSISDCVPVRRYARRSVTGVTAKLRSYF